MCQDFCKLFFVCITSFNHYSNHLRWDLQMNILLYFQRQEFEAQKYEMMGHGHTAVSDRGRIFLQVCVIPGT